MFAFLAALGPVGIGAAIVGTVATAAYAYMKDDEKSETTKSTSENTAHQEEKNKIIKTEIESFKSQQKKRLKDEYNINIEFHSNNRSKIIIDSKINIKPVSISNLENEIQELDNLISELERMKNESIC
jgi:predicted RNase H-like nuclease (RuvC/YqgF family)